MRFDLSRPRFRCVALVVAALLLVSCKVECAPFVNCPTVSNVIDGGLVFRWTHTEGRASIVSAGCYLGWTTVRIERSSR
jgi:hypothetical protein